MAWVRPFETAVPRAFPDEVGAGLAALGCALVATDADATFSKRAPRLLPSLLECMRRRTAASAAFEAMPVVRPGMLRAKVDEHGPARICSAALDG